MARFFLGSGTGSGAQHQRGEQQGGGAIPPSESFFLHAGRGGRGEDAVGYTRGFELWQHNHQIQREHQFYATAVYPDETPYLGPGPRPGRTIFGGGGGGVGVSCQDCGNQAKKDCAHLRCRTCCKSRGFQCSTHIKSTWVPAVTRRERQQLSAGEGSSKGGATAEPSKRPREIVTASTAIATTSTTARAGGRLEDEGFPPEVSAQAVFRCVRVSHVDEVDDVYAYQTAVSIGGHVFKGLLYDHGPEEAYPSSSSRYQLPQGECSSSPAAAAAATANAAATSGTAVAAELLEPYPTPLSAFMAGTLFFPPQHRP